MLTQVAEGVLVHQSELIRNNAVVIDGSTGVLLVEVESGTPYLVRFMVDAARGDGVRAVALGLRPVGGESHVVDEHGPIVPRGGRRTGAIAGL